MHASLQFEPFTNHTLKSYACFRVTARKANTVHVRDLRKLCVLKEDC